MKLTRIMMTLLTGLVCLGMSAATPKATTVPGDPMATQCYTLSNGLKVFLSVNHQSPRISAHIAVRTGSRNDPAETTGLAHYLEHLMFKGTQQFGTSNYAAEKPLLDTIEARYEQYRLVKDPERRRVLYHEIDSISQLAAQYNIPNEYDKLMAGIGGPWMAWFPKLPPVISPQARSSGKGSSRSWPPSRRCPTIPPSIRKRKSP